jgi:hypothetical protein
VRLSSSCLYKHIIIIVDVDQVVRDEIVVGQVPVVQTVDVVEDGLHVGDLAGGPGPKLLTWILETLCLNVAHLINCVVTLLTPLKFLVQEIQHREVK